MICVQEVMKFTGSISLTEPVLVSAINSAPSQPVYMLPSEKSVASPCEDWHVMGGGAFRGKSNAGKPCAVASLAPSITTAPL